MKTKYLIFSLFFSLIFGNLYSQDCEAWFFPYYDEGDYLTVNFQDGSMPQQSIISWDWNFGDGNTSDEQYPSHTYLTEGSFMVSLTINTGTCTDVFEDSVFISETFLEECVADFFYEVSVNDFLTVQFTDISFASEPIDSWQWNFGDGKTSIEQNPINVYEIDTTYLVSLVVTAGEFSDTVAYLVSVGDEFYQGDDCFAMFSYEQLDPAGLTYEFFDASYVPGDTVQSYLWSFGDGTESAEANPVHTFPGVNEYEVSLTVFSGECISTFVSYIYTGEDNWYPEDCQALFWFTTNPDNHREYQFYDFSYGNDEILYWFWDFGDGNISTQPNPYHEFAQDGNYEVSLFIETETCESLFPLEITVNENSQSGDSLMPLFYPDSRGDMVHFYNLTRGDVDNWEWDFGDGTNSTLASPDHYFDEPGIHEVALSAFSGNNVNTIVIRFDTSLQKAGNNDKGIDYAYFYPGGISKIETVKSLSFSVYPNPVKDILTIESSCKNPKIQIFNITGRLVFESHTSDSEIDIKDLPAGLYLLKVIGNDISGTVKFIKE